MLARISTRINLFKQKSGQMSSGKLIFRCGPAMLCMPIISPSVAEPTRPRGPAWAIMRSGGGENFQQGVVMRRLLCACAAVFALGVGTASAADLPIWAPGRTGPVMLPFTWAGPYFGLNIGGQVTSDTVRSTSVGPGFFPGEAQSLDAMSPGTVTSSGAIGGMQAGYNWQFDSNTHSTRACRSRLNISTSEWEPSPRTSRSPVSIAQPTNIGVRHSLSDNIFRLGLNFHFGWY